LNNGLVYFQRGLVYQRELLVIPCLDDSSRSQDVADLETGVDLHGNYNLVFVKTGFLLKVGLNEGLLERLLLKKTQLVIKKTVSLQLLKK
jgi:hypothetical protein